jgi:uncharacterized protein
MPPGFRPVLTILLILLLDFYFFQSVKLIFKDRKKSIRLGVYGFYWMFTAYGFALMIAAFIKPPHTWPYLFRIYGFALAMIPLICKMIGVIFILADDFIRMLRWTFRLRYRKTPTNHAPGTNKISRLRFLNQTALAMAAIPFSSFIFGMVKSGFDYRIRKLTLQLKNLPPAFDGLTIVHLSDIHSGSFINDNYFRHTFSMVNQLKPDLIFFTGDLVNNVTEEAQRFEEVWSTLKAPLGVYSVLGNHDYGDYVQWPNEKDKAENLQQMMNLHQRAGWNLLMNEHKVIERNGERIAILGVENWGAAMRFPKYGKLSAAYKGCEDVPVKLLLSHDPSHWDAQIIPQYSDIDVTFSGHTHGMQFGIEIPGFKWSPSKYFYKQWAGLYQSANQYLYVNRGLGFIGYPGRVGILPEITHITLSRSEASAES